jgi:hypothetical protein
MAPVFRKGYKSLGLAVGRNGAIRHTEVTPERLRVARQLTQRPLSAPASVEGVLIAVDLAGDPLACRIDRRFLPSVACLIPREMREVVRDLIDHQVHAEGIGEFDPGAEEPKRLRVTSLRAADAGRIDRTAWREHRPWQELALRQGIEPLRTDELPRLFDNDYRLLGGRTRRHWRPAPRAQVRKGRQAARRKAAPLGAVVGAKDSLLVSMCQIASVSFLAMSIWATLAPRCLPSRCLLRW